MPSPVEYQRALAAWFDDHADELAPHRRLEAPTLAEATIQDLPLQAVLFDAGWNRWGWPVAAGGLGGDAVLRAAYYDQLYASGYRFPESQLPLEVLAPALIRFAPTLAAQHLGPMLRGDRVWTQGFSEPEAGSDLANLRLRAVDAGDHFVVNGQKIWNSGAHIADHCGLLARTGDPDSAHRGLSMLWVDMDWPGITANGIDTITGRTELGEIFFDDVEVPKDRLIGDVGEGWAVAMYLLQWERGVYAWQRQAWLHSRLADLVATEALPTSAAARLGEAYELLFSLRVRSAATVRRLAAGENPGPETSIDKVLIASAEQTIFDAARELLRADLELGDDPESELWRWEYHYSRAASIYGGSAEVQRSILAERVLGLPREPAVGR